MTADAPAGPLARLEAWGAELRDRRLYAHAAAGGAVFGAVLYATLAAAHGAGPVAGFLADPAAALLSVALLAFFWLLVAGFAHAGYPRIFILTAMGHLVGYVLMSANLALAHAYNVAGDHAVIVLFGFTFLGFVGGLGLEFVLHVARNVDARRIEGTAREE